MTLNHNEIKLECIKMIAKMESLRDIMRDYNAYYEDDYRNLPIEHVNEDSKLLKEVKSLKSKVNGWFHDLGQIRYELKTMIGHADVSTSYLSDD
tara:strand:+ start:158 stop:439 length:282 start_codon:yes stop_codon:yes gene_type:complete